MLENPFLVVAMFFWLSYVPIAVVSVYQIIKNRKIFVEKDLRRVHNDPSIIFQITTRSATKTPVVKRGIYSIKNAARRIDFRNYQIVVVTDDPGDIITLAKEKCEVVVVRKDYRTNAIKKGRALQYAVEHRRFHRKNSSKYWVFHMDEESYVLPQTLLALLKFIREGKGIASEGPIFYPFKFESANRLTAIAESIRPFTCYDCVSQMTHPPPLHMHGSNLLVRSDVEDAVGWNFGPLLAEDQMFGYKVYEKYGPAAIGWHGGILLEQPPLNLRDHFLQRRRWFLGTLQNLRKFPRWHRYKLMFKSVTLFLGFASAMASTALSINAYVLPLFSLSGIDINMISSVMTSIPRNIPILSAIDSMSQSAAGSAFVEFGTAAILLFTTLVWISSYQLGLYLNLRYSKIGWPKRLLYHVQTLMLCPVIGMIETFPGFWATIEYFVKKQREPEQIPVYDFYVINK
ncbi:MAG TPA: glycosyltransferase family 2 protein [Nitrososphaera sp.]|nr:glycosyltransferase family 2 protein [Nitrososphaera sp.]